MRSFRCDTGGCDGCSGWVMAAIPGDPDTVCGCPCHKKIEKDYQKVVKQLVDAKKAQEPWIEVALQIARERSELASGEIVLEENQVRFSCQGTGIYSQEGWWESFPIHLLLERMKGQEKKA
jgi:hypothetical protein